MKRSEFKGRNFYFKILYFFISDVMPRFMRSGRGSASQVEELLLDGLLILRVGEGEHAVLVSLDCWSTLQRIEEHLEYRGGSRATRFGDVSFVVFQTTTRRCLRSHHHASIIKRACWVVPPVLSMAADQNWRSCALCVEPQDPEGLVTASWCSQLKSRLAQDRRGKFWLAFVHLPCCEQHKKLEEFHQQVDWLRLPSPVPGVDASEVEGERKERATTRLNVRGKTSLSGESFVALWALHQNFYKLNY